MAQFLAAGTFVIDLLPNSKHFLIPVVAGAHRDAQSVARLSDRLAIDEHQLIKRRLLRLRRVVDSSPKVRSRTKLLWQSGSGAAPGSCTGTSCVLDSVFSLHRKMHGGLVTAALTRFRAKMGTGTMHGVRAFPAFLRIARPDDQCALRVRSCCGEFFGRLCRAWSECEPAR